MVGRCWTWSFSHERHRFPGEVKLQVFFGPSPIYQKRLQNFTIHDAEPSFGTATLQPYLAWSCDLWKTTHFGCPKNGIVFEHKSPKTKVQGPIMPLFACLFFRRNAQHRFFCGGGDSGHVFVAWNRVFETWKRQLLGI